MIKKCANKNCEKDFYTRSSESKYCSPKCFHDSRRILDKSEKPCAECGKVTTNPKFCSMSCSGSFNGRAFPKKKRTKPYHTPVCRKCHKSPVAGMGAGSVCESCKNEKRNKILETTVKELRESSRVKTLSNFHAIIRGYGKTIYESSGLPKKCAICGYSAHYEVCHIKPISSFPDTTTLRVIHDISNLVALCPNHHWEFDHGITSL
jgi:hypothetical protein